MPAGRTTTVAAVRGATSVGANDAESICAATAALLQALMSRNRLKIDQVVSAVFTTTPDLNAVFPALAARRLGWSEVPLLGATEMAVPGAPPRLVRVLLTVGGVAAGRRLRPVYLGEAESLRPDLMAAATVPAGAESVARFSDPFEMAPGERPAGDSPGAARRAVAIVGLGQIGGSIGLALGRSTTWRRVGFDRDPAVAAEAVRRGVVDEAASSVESACRDAEIGVAAVTVDQLPAVIEAMSEALPAGALLVDTGSARRTVTPALEQAARRGIRAVGGHPLTGSEGHGLAAARSDLFDGSRFALLPVGGAIPGAAFEFVEAVGATPLTVDDGMHDEALARTSHLPYLVACALHEAGRTAAAAGLAGPAFRDMTRIAAARPGMARAYCEANAGEIQKAWRDLQARINGLVGGLGSEAGSGRARSGP